MNRRGMTLIELAVAIAVALVLYLGLAGQVDALRRMQHLAATKLAAREAAALAARRWLADPTPETRRLLEERGLPGWTVRLERAGDAGLPGVARWRVRVASPAGADAVEVVVRD